MWQAVQQSDDDEQRYNNLHDRNLGQTLLQERVLKVKDRALRRNAQFGLAGTSVGQQMIKDMIVRRKKIARRQRIARCVPPDQVENVITHLLVIVLILTMLLFIACIIWSMHVNTVEILLQDTYARPVTLLLFVSWSVAICVYVALVKLHDIMREFEVDPDDDQE